MSSQGHWIVLKFYRSKKTLPLVAGAPPLTAWSCGRSMDQSQLIVFDYDSQYYSITALHASSGMSHQSLTKVRILVN